MTNHSSINPSYKVIVDHLRSSSFLIADGVMPSNEGRGYVLRRIMRRAMRHIHKLGSKETVMYKLVPILIKEMGVNPAKISLAHSDPSGKDFDYQRRMLDRGVWLEFDMIGLDISFPKEGIAPTVTETVDAIFKLIEMGYEKQIVLSHDVFLKQMWAKNGGNGWGFVPNVFLSLLSKRGVDKKIIDRLCIDNPANLLA